MNKTLVLTVILATVLPFISHAKIGVGVGSGSIQVDENLKAGLVYTLPSLPVLNTGDEPSYYGVGIQHREGQEELVAPNEWFTFTPETFYLEPGQVMNVEVKLTLPLNDARPGDYFVFLQAFPEKKVDMSGTSLGIAAASKLYFTIAPSNLLAALYYRGVSLTALYSPWSYALFGTIILAVIINFLRKRISFGISLRKKE